MFAREGLNMGRFWWLKTSFMSFCTIFWEVILGWYYDVLGWKFIMIFLSFLVKFILRQIQDWKGWVILSKKIPQQFIHFFLLGRKKKLNKLLWYHPKITSQNIVRKGHELVFRARNFRLWWFFVQVPHFFNNLLLTYCVL